MSQRLICVKTWYISLTDLTASSSTPQVSGKYWRVKQVFVFQHLITILNIRWTCWSTQGKYVIAVEQKGTRKSSSVKVETSEVEAIEIWQIKILNPNRNKKNEEMI